MVKHLATDRNEAESCLGWSQGPVRDFDGVVRVEV